MDQLLPQEYMAFQYLSEISANSLISQAMKFFLRKKCTMIRCILTTKTQSKSEMYLIKLRPFLATSYPNIQSTK